MNENTKTYKIAILRGDGIGVEIINEAIKVLRKIEQISPMHFEFIDAKIGGDAIDHYNDPYPTETEEICKNSDAILLGAVGGEKWDHIDPSIRPEKGLLRLRASLELYSNLRPVKLYEPLIDHSPLKREIVEGVDILIVRELTGGIYFGKRETGIRDNKVRFAKDVEEYDENEIRRIAKVAFESALSRKKKVTLVDKANVLDSSKLWREVVQEVHKDYTEVELNFMYVDNCAMQLVRNPKMFDVILTNNIFGDILSDEASVITGSIGLLPSASIGSIGINMYEPIHGSAPDIQGLDICNPLGTILSAAMMLRYSFHAEKEARLIENAVEKVISDGYYTRDLSDECIKCSEMGNKVCEYIR